MIKAALLILTVIISIALLGRLIIAVFIPSARVTSWYRTPWKNKAVGGKAKSWHLIGWAYDLTPANSTTETAARAIGFFKVVNEGDHIHLQIF